MYQKFRTNVWLLDINVLNSLKDIKLWVNKGAFYGKTF